MPVPTEPVRLSGPPVREDVAAQLENLLVTGALAPGARLADADLVALTGTSRAPVREALNQLESVGLVVVEPRRATRVSTVDGVTTLESLQIDAEVVAQSLAETPAPTRGPLSDGLLDSAEAFRAALRGRGLRPLLHAVVAATGNPEYVRLQAEVAPVVDRHLALHADLLGTGRAAELAAVLDASRDDHPEEAVARWTAWVDAVRADLALPDPRGTDREATGPTPTAGTLRARAADVIESAILDGTLVPGETLRETDLMTWLGVSRTPVREALTTLARRGLVTQEHHHPARITTVDEAGLRQLLRALGVLRRLGVRLAVAADGTALAGDIEALLPDWESAADPESLARVARRTSAAIDARCGSRRLAELAARGSARGAWTASHHPAVRQVANAATQRTLVAAARAGRAQEAADVVWREYALDPTTPG